MHIPGETDRESQPCSLDGQVWLTADARVDDRTNLIRKLASAGRDVLPDATDGELILHAYHAWEERCVDYLLGDFAFAIWDGRCRRLFCARDHFGVKPFFYARTSACLVFSNTLNCVRLHPAVSTRLNDLSIADFLLFDYNQDPALTAFADVQRLAPAHTLTCSAGTVRVDRYWTLPSDGDIRFRRQEDYVERFKEIWRAAVSDRVRTARVGVLMSGGMDSPAVAAAARKLVSDGPAPRDVRAYTVVVKSLIRDDERYYSGLVAQALEIPVHYVTADDYQLYERWDLPEMHTPEPNHEPWTIALNYDLLQRAAGHSRVMLTGQGGDPAMLGSSTYALSLLTSGAWGRLAADLWHTLSRGKLPRVGFRAHLRHWFGRARPPEPLPGWLNPDLVARLDLGARQEKFTRDEPAKHMRRPEAWRTLRDPSWPYFFDSYDPTATGLPIEHRHPFFDLRVVTYLLAIPPFPWCDHKEVLRRAMVGLLPESVRRRPKTCVSGDPLPAFLAREESSWVDRFEAAPELERYVVRRQVPSLLGETDRGNFHLNLRPLSLNYWLRSRNQVLSRWKESQAEAVSVPRQSCRESLSGSP
jgi:asparagine synthase (glutamine-hydrolysing)